MSTKNRFLMIVAVISLLAIGLPALATNAATPVYKGKRPLNIAQFNAAITSLDRGRVEKLDQLTTHATIPELQVMFAQQQLTSEELTKFYLSRIQRYDVDKLNSMTELNPDVLEIAKQMDAERQAGNVRGPLHGTVAVLKDVIGTGDKMHNTGGAKAMRDAMSDRDAFVVARLRAAGVIILGKASVTEWGNFIAFKQRNGYSTLGGQVVNPYNAASDPGGSSTGSGVATASNFTTFAIGEDSWGSLIIPAHANSAAALRPSMGMVSRDRVIPLVGAHDMLGPITRNITDLALVMDAIAATDVNDPITIAASSAEKGFAQRLNGDGLRGKRVGVFQTISPDDDHINKQMIKALTDSGAQVIEIPRLPSLIPGIFDELDPITAYWAKFGGERYFADTRAPIRSFAEFVAFNEEDPADRVKYGQEYYIMTRDTTMTSDEYDRGFRKMLTDWKGKIDGIMAKDNLDFIGGTGFALLDGVFFPGPGYPTLALQAGYRSNKEPVGFVMMGRLFDDAKLIRAAFALERNSKAWRPPKLGN